MSQIYLNNSGEIHEMNQLRCSFAHFGQQEMENRKQNKKLKIFAYINGIIKICATLVG